MEFDLDQVLNPAAVFNHPRDVLNDPDLTKQEKRAILSSWASDACAVESMSSLRQRPGGAAPVSFDDIVDALRSLDDDPPPRPGGLAMRFKKRGRRGDARGAYARILGRDTLQTSLFSQRPRWPEMSRRPALGLTARGFGNGL
jgi:hypothetical protein